ncbi:hypothetical protein VB773_13110 [Haloarculaceae archaeon H-GB2-1]|nr:hypothetical protein [Haloarculaceae archaeon H-GB1-1]MEA5408409.1 hypothetical protein [Haloarculaceae archaeon H-GB2-1]
MKPTAFDGRIPDPNLDRIGAILGFVIALGLFPLRFVASQVYIDTIPGVLGLACLGYLLTRRGGRLPTSLPKLPRWLARSLPPVVFLGLSGLVAVAIRAGQRTVGFYALAGIVGSILLAQILFGRDDDVAAGLILVQIVALAAVVRFMALYTTPGLIGIDSWTHITQLAHDVRAAESLSAIDTNKHYTTPLYHLLVVASSLLLETSLRNGLYLSLGIVMPVSVCLIYATAMLVLEQRWALLAAAMYAVSDYVIEWGIHIIPTSMGLLLFIAVCYWLVRVMRTDSGMQAFVILTATTIFLALTHQVSSFIMLVTIAAGVAAYVVIVALSRFSADQREIPGENSVLDVGSLLVFDVVFIGFLWSFTPYDGDSFLRTVTRYFQETFTSSVGVLKLAGGSSGGGGASGGGTAGGAAAAQGPDLAAQLAVALDTAGFLLLLGATFLGSLYLLHRGWARQSVLTLVLATAFMLVFVMILPLFGIRNFIPQRWFAFLYVPMTILAAVGIRALTLRVGRGVLVACLLPFLLVFPSVMIGSAHGTLDNPVFEEQQEQLAYTADELAAVEAVGRLTGSPDSMNIRPDQVIYTDHPYATVLRRTGAYPTAVATLNDSERTPHDLTLYRQRQTAEATYFLDSSERGRIKNVPRERVCRPGQAVVYSNRDVALCAEAPAPSN